MHKDTDKLYHRSVKSTKLHHWRDWLERAEDPDIWTVQKLLAAPATDGSSARIPALKYTVGETHQIAASNDEKGHVLAKSFFPAKPPQEPLTELFFFFFFESINVRLKAYCPM
jgi:hypothetical protein